MQRSKVAASSAVREARPPSPPAGGSPSPPLLGPLIGAPPRRARSRRGRARLDLREAGLAQQLRDRRRLARADLERRHAAPASRRCRREPAHDVEPVRARSQRERGLVARRSPGEPSAVLDVGRVGDHGVERPAHRGEQVAVDELDSSPSRAALARATASASALTSVAHHSRSGRSRFSASATAPEPVPTSQRARPRGRSSAASTRCSVSGRGISTRGSTASSIVPEALAAEDVGDRLALAPAAREVLEARAASGLELHARVGDHGGAPARPSPRRAAPPRRGAASRTRPPSAR
jgi:hypothetical protein